MASQLASRPGLPAFSYKFPINCMDYTESQGPPRVPQEKAPRSGGAGLPPQGRVDDRPGCQIHMDSYVPVLAPRRRDVCGHAFAKLGPQVDPFSLCFRALGVALATESERNVLHEIPTKLIKRTRRGTGTYA